MYPVAVLWALVAAVYPSCLPVKNELAYRETNDCSELTGCRGEVVGPEGSVRHLLLPGATPEICEWNIVVRKGFVVELEFEVFRLPADDCATNLEIFYSPQEEELFRQRICPTDRVDKMSTGSRRVHLHFRSGFYPEEPEMGVYGFEIHYRGVAAKKKTDDHAVTVALLSCSSVLFAVAVILCCMRRRVKGSRCLDVAHEEGTLQQQDPNVPTRAQLHSAMERERRSLQAPRLENIKLPFVIFQSEASYPDSGVAKEKSPRPLHTSIAPEQPKISIGTTPHLRLHEARMKWSSDSVRRIRNLRTRLVDRFSSRSSSDMSVFYDAVSYTQLACDDVTSPEEPTPPEVFRPEPKPVPTIVIQFAE